MEDVARIITTVIRDWWLLGVAASFGVAWYQGKEWFRKLNQDMVDAHSQRMETAKHVREIHAQITRMGEQISSVVKSQTEHEKELVRNTEQHAAIVKGLEKHVSDNQEHDQAVKASLAVILDRLRAREH